MAAGSNPIASFTKDPDGVLDYTVDWTQWLGSDTILTASWVVPAGINQQSAMNSSKTATIWLSGGVAGTSYNIVSRVVTVGNRTDDRTIRINVVER